MLCDLTKYNLIVLMMMQNNYICSDYSHYEVVIPETVEYFERRMDTPSEQAAVTEDVSNRQPYHAGNMDDHEIKTQRIVITMTMSFV